MCMCVCLMVAGLQSTQLEFSFLRGAGPDRAEGARGRRGAALLIPQDGVLVIKLQLLHRSSTALLSATVPVFHNLKGLLHFSVPEKQPCMGSVTMQLLNYIKLLPIGSTHLRVSTCLAVASRDGNCVSLKISGGPWVCTRLVVVSRAPGGRYTPAGFDSGASSSSTI